MFSNEVVRLGVAHLPAVYRRIADTQGFGKRFLTHS